MHMNCFQVLFALDYFPFKELVEITQELVPIRDRLIYKARCMVSFKNLFSMIYKGRDVLGRSAAQAWKAVL